MYPYLSQGPGVMFRLSGFAKNHSLLVEHIIDFAKHNGNSAKFLTALLRKVEVFRWM